VRKTHEETRRDTQDEFKRAFELINRIKRLIEKQRKILEDV